MTDQRIRHASLDTNFGRASDQLSRIASELRRLDIREQQCYEDMDVYDAPSECGKIIKDHIEREMQAICEKYQLSREDMYELIADRITSKWVHYNIILR